MMRRHDLDPVSLTFGFVFAGLGLLFLVGRADEALRLRWIWPLLLLALGVGILLDIARTSRRTDPDPDATPTDPGPTPTDPGPTPASPDATPIDPDPTPGS
jgi:hypothetical protein